MRRNLSSSDLMALRAERVFKTFILVIWDGSVVLVAPMDHSDLRERLGLKAPPLNLMYIAATVER